MRVIVTVEVATLFGTEVAAGDAAWGRLMAPTGARYVLRRGVSSEPLAAVFDQVYLWRRTDSAAASRWHQTGMPWERPPLAGLHYQPFVQRWILR